MTKKARNRPTLTTCPCGNGLPYAACCEVFHLGQPAATAQALMRSRYTAYVLGLERYLRETWHASTRPEQLDLSRDGALQWLGLQVFATAGGMPDDVTGRVEFVARFKVNGKAGRLHEASRFVREDGKWFYVDGESQPAAKRSTMDLSRGSLI